ncbi:MAG: J domain-containing protein [Oculatellaceae cyanobacterium bins.114]|nr:J domain-containing protein [Oculatellaceae cyanobacterium bins.114]
MHSKSLKFTFPIKADGVEGAIAQLSSRFLKPTRTSCKVVQEPTDFALLELCKPLIEDWKSGKVAFANGEITLTFTSGKLAREADLLVYSPEQGDRFLYTGKGFAAAPQQLPISGVIEHEAIAQVAQPLQTLVETLNQLTAHQRAVENRLQTLILQAPTTASSQAYPSDLQAVMQQALAAQASAFNQQLQSALEAQAATFAQILSSQLTSTALHFNKRLDVLQTQLEQLAAQLKELGELSEPIQVPQTDADWLTLIKRAWGMVGDYEQYSLSHRLANAETPLFAVPDWVALCEFDWAHKLSPTLAFLYDLIHGDNGIGYSGADILQQFGRHVDAQTGEPYYIYHQGGFTAYEALWQTASNGEHSWLPELQRLSVRIANRHPDIFELFGWEPEAIASLESVIKRATYQRQSGRQTASDSQSHAQQKTNAMSDYLAILNIGPFTPITLELIKRAYKQAIKTAHPDTGGSKEQAQRVNEAYEAVLKHYFPQAT